MAVCDPVVLGHFPPQLGRGRDGGLWMKPRHPFMLGSWRGTGVGRPQRLRPTSKQALCSDGLPLSASVIPLTHYVLSPWSDPCSV